MNHRSLIWIGMIVGTTIGGFIPMLWGDSAFSFVSVITSAIGGFVGIYIGFRMMN